MVSCRPRSRIQILDLGWCWGSLRRNQAVWHLSWPRRDPGIGQKGSIFVLNRRTISLIENQLFSKKEQKSGSDGPCPGRQVIWVPLDGHIQRPGFCLLQSAPTGPADPEGEKRNVYYLSNNNQILLFIWVFWPPAHYPWTDSHREGMKRGGCDAPR